MSGPSLFRSNSTPTTGVGPKRSTSSIFKQDVSENFSAEMYQRYTDISMLDGNESQTTKLKLSTNRMTEEDLGNVFEEYPNVTELRLICSEETDSKGLSSIPESICLLKALNILDVRNNPLNNIPKPLLSLVPLTRLHLSLCRITEIPDLSVLCNLQLLSIDDNRLHEIPDSLYNLRQLQELYLSKNFISAISNSISKLDKLRRLDLTDNNLQKFPMGITKLKNLVKLLLGNNGIQELPENIGDMESLKYFDISQNYLLKVPASIGKLTSLRYLKLVTNFITSLPIEITHLNIVTDSFLIGDNNLQIPPQQVCENGLESIKGYFEAAGKDNGIHNMRLKLMLLGECGAGKTSLAGALVKGTVQSSEPTVQMDFYTWKPRPQIDQLEIRIVDCAGERKYLLTHHFFMSEGCLYVIVVNLEAYDLTDEAFHVQICEWIEAVLCKVTDATILVVGTHRDQIEPKNLIEERSHDIVSKISEFSSTLTRPPVKCSQGAEKGPFFTSTVADCSEKCCLTGEGKTYLQFVSVSSIEDLDGMQVLRDEICRIADSRVLAPIVNCDLFPSWINFEEYISSLRLRQVPHPVVLRKDLLKVAHEHYGLDEPSAISALRYFNSVGTVSYFHSDKLCKHVIVDPSWLPSLLRHLFRLNLKKNCVWDSDYFHMKYNEDNFNHDMNFLVKQGKLHIRLLRCIWHKSDIDETVFEFLVSLLEDFDLITKKDKDDISLVPWFFSQTVLPEKFEEHWPKVCPPEKFQVRIRYEVKSPYDVLSGLFDRLSVATHINHNHNFCRHWKTGILFDRRDFTLHCYIEKGRPLSKLCVEGRCQRIRLRELWLHLLKVHYSIRDLLKSNQGISYNTFVTCPRQGCHFTFDAQWSTPSFEMKYFCRYEDEDVQLDLLRPPIDILDEYLNPEGNDKSIFLAKLSSEEEDIIRNELGNQCTDFGIALDVPKSIVKELSCENREKPGEMIRHFLEEVRKSHCEVTRRHALTALRRLDPIPQSIIDAVLEKILS